jgi:hypothetical protein
MTLYILNIICEEQYLRILAATAKVIACKGS